MYTLHLYYMFMLQWTLCGCNTDRTACSRVQRFPAPDIVLGWKLTTCRLTFNTELTCYSWLQGMRYCDIVFWGGIQMCDSVWQRREGFKYTEKCDTRWKVLWERTNPCESVFCRQHLATLPHLPFCGPLVPNFRWSYFVNNHRFTEFIDRYFHIPLPIVTKHKLGLPFPPRNRYKMLCKSVHNLFSYRGQ